MARRWVAALVAAALVATMSLVGVLTVAPAAAAAGGLRLDGGPVTVLAGEDARLSFVAGHVDGATDVAYNVGFAVTLPPGATYAPGSTDPAASGDPRVTTVRPSGVASTWYEVLTWENVADLVIGGSVPLAFGVDIDEARFPVGSTLPVAATVHGSADERNVPRPVVDSTGTAPVISLPATFASGTGTSHVRVVPLELEKDEESPEAEVLRGVGTQSSVWTLTVRTAPAAGTDDVLVVDHLPAALQLLGCESLSRPLDCDDALVGTSVVVDPPGLPAGVWTRVEWNLGAVPAGTDVTIRYRAAVGPQELVADGTFTGASTRHLAAGGAVTNHAAVTGTYRGAVARPAAADVHVTAEHTVEVRDVALVKSTTATGFTEQSDARFALLVRVGEYTDATSVLVTDVMPDGTCPYVEPGTATSGPWPSDCAALPARDVVGATMTTSVAHGDGTFTSQLVLDDVGHDGDVTVEYDVYLRATRHDGTPTSTGDTFTNAAVVTATTSPVPGTPEDGPVAVEDDSSATLASDLPVLVKRVWANPDRTPLTGVAQCSALAGADWSATSQPVVRLGDLLCFRVEVAAADGVALREAVVRDFVPVGTEFVEGVVASNPTGVTVQQVVEDGAPAPAWRIGDTVHDGWFLPAGARVAIDVLARVTETSPTQRDVMGNLAKLRARELDGSALALRDEVGFVVAPAVPLALDKTVQGGGSVQTGHLVVREGLGLTYRVAVTHGGSAADDTAHPLDSVEVADALPAGFTCDDLVAPAPDCTDDERVRIGGTSTTRSLVTWSLDGAALGADGLLTVGETVTLAYDLTVPSPLSVSSRHVNTASVTRYTSPTTDGRPGAAPTAYVPEGALTGSGTPNAPAATDTARLSLPDAGVTKALVSTGPDEVGNGPAQATVGEVVTFRYTATLAAGTSLFAGRLTDTLPTGGTFAVTGASAQVPAGATVDTTATCTPAATVFCLDTTTGELRFPPVWTNGTAATQEFAVTLTGRVADVAGATDGADLLDTATLTSRDSATDGTDRTRATDTAEVGVVLPAPTVAKTPLDAAGRPVDPLAVGAGQTVTFELTASNGENRPPAHDTVVVDCLPTDLTLVTPLPAGLTAGTATDADDPCESGRTTVTWAVGTLEGGASAVTTYQAVVDPGSAGGTTSVNTARLTASTLANGANGSGHERVLTSSDTGTVRVPVAEGSKVADRDTAVPGETITWTLRTTLPPHANFYDLAVLDTVPAGLAPAVEDSTVTCTYPDATTWDCGTPTPVTAAGAAGTTLAAWVLGDVPADVLPRDVTVTFTSTVAAAGRLTAGDAVTNTATLGWFATGATRTVGPTTTYNRTAVIGTDSVTVDEPRVTVDKSVSDATVEPTQVVTYTVTTSAATAAPHGEVAHDVTVVDTVPAGVVPLADDDDAPAATGDVVGGGTWDATARTITWTHAAITPGTPVVRTYDARLADADELTGARLTNSVRAQEWASLDPATPGGRTYNPSAPATAAVTPQLPLVNTTKTQVGANPVYVGDEVAFEVRLRNAGGATAATLGLRDLLPDAWEYVAGSATVQVPSAAAVALGDPAVSGQVLTWSLVGGPALDLAPGATVVVTYRATPTAAALHATGSAVAHRNTAVVTDVTDLAGGTSYDGGDGSYVGTTGTATARLHAADLRIAKTHSTWVAGTSTNTWTVTVTNAGPDPAVGVRVSDVIGTLPTGVSVVSVAGTGWTCVARGGDLQTGADCTRTASLASGASASVTVTVALAADVASGTEVANTASVSTRTYDPLPSNDTTTDTATVTTQADLLVTKTGPASVAAGALATWDVTVRNAGPSVSRGSAGAPVVLTDTLPAGVSVTSITPTGATCDEAPDGVLTCLRTSDLPVDGTFTVQVTARVDAALVAADGPLVNTAEVTPVTSQGPNTRRDVHTTSTAITHAEQLGVTKALVGELVPGQPATYRVTVRNDGPSVARGVVVTDDLPTGLRFAGGVTPAAAWDCTGTTSVTCELDTDLGVGATASFTFDVTVASSVVGDVENTAVVGSTWQADQDDDTVTSGPRVLADLGITKTHTGTVLRAGEGTTFRITVTNHGPSDAPGPITVTDEVPAGLPVDGAVTADAGTCSVGAALPWGAQPVTCTLPAGLDAGDSWAIDVPVAVPADAPEATHTNTAVVSGPTDLDEGDDVQPNTATDTLDVVRRADVAVVKTAGATSVVAGTDVTYTLAVGNAGPSVAAATVVRDVLPATLAPVSAAVPGDPDACTVTGQTVRCELGDVAPGATPTVTVVATVRSGVADGSTVVNTATVASTTTDVDGTGPSSDEDDASIATTTAAELSLTKSPASQQLRAGADATFTLVATNDGPSDVAGPVTITDTLPAGTSLVATTTPTGAPAWECAAPVGQVVTCTLGDGTAGLTAGASAPGLVLVTRVAPDLDPVTLTNSAVASSPLSGDSDPATADVVVTTFADLGVTKSHVATPVAGRSFQWAVTVRNGGPSDSRADADDPIVVVDRLPFGVTFAATGLTHDGFTCAAGAPVDVGGTLHATVRCERPTTLPAGAEATFQVPVLLDPHLLGDVTNTVTVTPGLTPQPADAVLPDTATDTIDVTGIADLGLVKSLVTPTVDVVAGLPVQWRLDVTNHGPSTSRADATTPLVVVDTLPAGVRDVTASGAGWACTVDAAEVTCERTTDLPVGAAPAITVDAVVASGTTAALPNTATVTPGSTPQQDPAPIGPGEPDTDDVTVTPTTRADLRLDKSVTAEPVAGATGTFRLRVTNLGPSDAVDVVLHDTLPAGLTATGVVTSSGGTTWTCTGTVVVECALDGTLPAATSVWLDLEVAADQALTGDVTNTAHVTSGTPDPDPTNDGSSVVTGTGTLAALTLDKSHTGTVRVGDPLTFDLVVGNRGPSQARGVTLEDLVPAALDVTGVRSADPAWVCSTGTPGASGTPVLCVRAELDARTTAPPVHVDVVVTAAAYPGVTNTATVVSATPSVDDPTGARATDDDTLDVPAQVALHLSKALDGTHLQAGAAATYLLTVSNEGPTADPGPVTITDVLPAGLRLASTDGAPCTADGRTVTCTVDGLDVGEQATVRVHVLVDRDAPAQVTNTATVASAAEDVAPDGAGTASARADVRAVPLAVTGAESAALALLAAFLLAGGAGAVLTARRGRGRHSV